MPRKCLRRLNASVGLAAESKLRTMGSSHQVDSLLRYLSSKVGLMVNLIEVTVRVLWRQVSSSAGFYSREFRKNKKGTVEEGEQRRDIRTLHSLCEGREDCLVYSRFSSGQIFTRQFWGK